MVTQGAFSEDSGYLLWQPIIALVAARYAAKASKIRTGICQIPGYHDETVGNLVITGHIIFSRFCF